MRYGLRIGGLFLLAATLSRAVSPAQLHNTPDSVSVHISKNMTMVIEDAPRDPSASNPLVLLKDEEFDSEIASPTQQPECRMENSQTDRKERAISNSNASHSKELYLTFDDGPLRGTGNVLNVLKEEGVSATMFCVGRHVRRHPALFRQELSMPNLQIANHTYSHANGHYSRFYSDTFKLLSDVEHAQLIVGGRKYLRLAGRNVWRLPEVSRDDHAVIALRGRREVPKYDTLFQEGYFIFGWDVEWHFDHRTGHPIESPETLAARIEGCYRHGHPAENGKVVLLAHDFMFRNRYTTAELRRFIRLMKQKGWSFKTIKHYSRRSPEPLYVAKYYGKKRPTSIALAVASSDQRVKKRHLPSAKLPTHQMTPSRQTPVAMVQSAHIDPLKILRRSNGSNPLN